MVVGQYIMASGIAGPSEQDTLDRLDEFMLGALGWSRIDVVADTTTDNDRVWVSSGEEEGKYPPMYVRAQATGGAIRFFGYTAWDQSASIGDNEISDFTQLQITNNNNGGLDEYVFLGNKDAVFVSVRLNSDFSCRFGGFGYFDSFYDSVRDSYPLWVLGQSASTSTFLNTFRVRAYGYDPAGFLSPVSTYSGGAVGFLGTDASGRTSLATPNPRDGRHLMIKNVFYRRRSDTEGDIPGYLSHEIRGELPGVYQFYGSNFVAHDTVVASGISTVEGVPASDLGEGVFVVARSSEANTFTLGPAVWWAPAPSSISGMELWLTGGAVHRIGGSYTGGAVGSLIDLSGSGNEASQAISLNQPTPVSSGVGFNGLPYVKFDGSNFYVTGALTYVNNYTVFVVADYSSSGRSPLFYIRGPIATNDTILSLEFNNGLSDSVSVRVRTDDSPLEEDELRISGLFSGSTYIVSTVVSGSNTSLYVNGDSSGVSTISSTKTTFAGSSELNYGVGTTLDANGVADSVAIHYGGIAEVIVYNRDLTIEERQSVVCYLGDKYGVVVSGTCA